MSSDIKSLPAISVETAVRRSREIQSLVASLAAERKLLDKQVIAAVGVGKAIEVDGRVTRVKQSSGSLLLPIEALEAARQSGDVPRGAYMNVTQRVVNLPLVRKLHEIGRLHPAIEPLVRVGDSSAPYIDHL